MIDLLMCCTPINREEFYHKELRFVYLAAKFFKKQYPNANIFVGTTENAKIPNYLFKDINFLTFPFEKYPFALARQIFYKEFCKSDNFKNPIIFSGSDVIFSNRIQFNYNQNPIIMSYRYHPTMPYCSDFIFVNNKYRNECIDFFDKVIFYLKWMPREIQSSWADQLALARTIGYLNDEEFDGCERTAPNIKEIKLVSGYEYLYTPNDAFPSKKDAFNGLNLKDVLTLSDYENLLKTKIGIHFKGNRKKFFIMLSYIAFRNKIIEIDNISFDQLNIQELFDEGIELYKKYS